MPEWWNWQTRQTQNLKVLKIGDIHPLQIDAVQMKIFVDVNIKDFINEHLELLKNNISPDWWKNVKYVLNQFLKYTQINKINNIKEVNGRFLEHFRSSRLKQVKKTTVQRNMVIIGSLLNRAVQFDILESNPIKKLTRLSGITSKKIRFLSKEEIKKVLNVTKNTYLEYFVLIAIYTGLRRRELINLEFQDIDINKKLIYVKHKIGFTTKSRKERVVPIHNKILEFFHETMEGLCFKYEGRKIQEDTASRNFKTLMHKINLNDIGLHTLRHTFASHLAMSGVPLRTISEYLGHSTTYVTELYSHLDSQHLNTEIQKLNFL